MWQIKCICISDLQSQLWRLIELQLKFGLFEKHQAFCHSLYFSQTRNLKAEFVYIFSTQSRQTNSACSLQVSLKYENRQNACSILNLCHFLWSWKLDKYLGTYLESKVNLGNMYYISTYLGMEALKSNLICHTRISKTISFWSMYQLSIVSKWMTRMTKRNNTLLD